MAFPSGGPGAVGGPTGNFRFTRPPGSGGTDVVMGPQGPIMSGPRGFLNIAGVDGGGGVVVGPQRGPAPFSGGPSGGGGAGMMQSTGAAGGGVGGDFGTGVDVPTSQEFPMPPNFPGAIEMMTQVRDNDGKGLIRACSVCIMQCILVCSVFNVFSLYLKGHIMVISYKNC